MKVETPAVSMENRITPRVHYVSYCQRSWNKYIASFMSMMCGQTSTAIEAMIFHIHKHLLGNEVYIKSLEDYVH